MAKGTKRVERGRCAYQDHYFATRSSRRRLAWMPSALSWLASTSRYLLWTSTGPKVPHPTSISRS